MSWAQINNLDVISARLCIPRTGAWTADVAVDAQTAAQVPQGAAATLTLAAGVLTWSGTVQRVDSYAQSVTLRMVGGSNGLGVISQPRFYQGVAISTPLNDVLGDAQESLSERSSGAVLAAQLGFWTTIAQPVGNVLTNLVNAGPDGSVWRVLNDGTVFVGVDVFPPTQLTDYQLLNYLPDEGLQLIGAEVPNIFPGESFNGHNVSAVEHQIGADAGGNRVKVYFEH